MKIRNILVSCSCSFAMWAGCAAVLATPQDLPERSVWKVKGKRLDPILRTPASEVGSAFLIDRRGYFLTASHVIRDQRKLLGSLKIVPTDGSGRDLEFTVVRDWCTFVDSIKKRCTEGDDVALLELDAKEDLSAYSIVELDFDSETYFRRTAVVASVIGYPARSPASSPDRTPAANGFVFSVVPNTSPAASIPYLYYTNDGVVAAGHSGGPALRTLDGREIAVGVVSWGEPEEAPPSAYLVPTLMLHGKLEESPALVGDPRIDTVATGINENKTEPYRVRNTLSTMSNLQVVHVFRLLNKNPPQTGQPEYINVNDRYIDVLLEIVLSKRLGIQRASIPPEAYCRGPLATEFSCKLEAGRVALRVGTYHSITADAGVAVSFFEQGADLIRESLRLDAASGQTTRVLGAAALDVAYAYAALDRTEESIEWAAASYAIEPSAVSSETLARHYVESDPENAAYLYQKSFEAGLQEDYVVEGYEYASSGADLGGELENFTADTNKEDEIRTRVGLLVPEESDAARVVAIASVP